MIFYHPVRKETLTRYVASICQSSVYIFSILPSDLEAAFDCICII